jgi:hypothetical protein
MNKLSWIATALVLTSAGCGVDEPSEVDTVESSISGSTCAAGAQDDYLHCVADYYYVCIDPFEPVTYTPCRNLANQTCGTARTAALTKCSAGLVRVFRTVGDLGHRETMVPAANATTEGAFSFASTPQPGANQQPIYRCGIDSSAYHGDYPTRSASCDGTGTPWSFHGFSFARGTLGTSAVYRCRVGADHFMSRAANCEGQVFEGLIGYAK